LNSPDARFCARCGTALGIVPAAAPAVPTGAPHWVFTLTFVCFLLLVLVALLHAVGPVMLVVLPVALYSLKRGAGSKSCRRRAQYT